MSEAVSVAAAKARLAECIRRAEEGDRVVITRHGKVVAALVSAADLAELRRLRVRSDRGSLLELVGLDAEDAFAEIARELISERGEPRAVPDFA
ncbi:MAG: type II toxin-antitoxin system prevent-host-death family antitoxin [Candidatus Schekmanbacteria bacterium]|nr:type II toxin-antitoxin system prevent-host-death family antitoxin [Candidatus Schekmanbacteria bacterium]